MYLLLGWGRVSISMFCCFSCRAREIYAMFFAHSQSFAGHASRCKLTHFCTTGASHERNARGRGGCMRVPVFATRKLDVEIGRSLPRSSCFARLKRVPQGRNVEYNPPSLPLRIFIFRRMVPCFSVHKWEGRMYIEAAFSNSPNHNHAGSSVSVCVCVFTYLFVVLSVDVCPLRQEEGHHLPVPPLAGPKQRSLPGPVSSLCRRRCPDGQKTKRNKMLECF